MSRSEVEAAVNTRLEAALKRLVRPWNLGKPLSYALSAPPATRGEVQSPLVRSRCLRRIRYLVGTYGFDWIVAQWTELLGPLKGMDSAELLAVLADLDRAYACLREGIPLEDVSLAPATVVQAI